MIPTDIVFYFILSLITFLTVYQLMQHTHKKITLADKLSARARMLAAQQDALLEEAEHRASMFTKSDAGKLEEVTQTKRKGIISSIHTIMRDKGITDISITVFIILCTVGGATCATGAVYFNFLHPVFGIPIGLCIGSYLVYSLLVMIVERKRMAFLRQFPDAIDMMIRGVKAGLNIGKVMKLVSIESKDPLASVFRTISQKLELGVTAEQAFVTAANEIGIEEFRFLVVALVLQMENGGTLGEVLQNLSSMVRKRLELGLKLKALSAEARMSAIIISALPFVFAGIMALINPSHLSAFVTYSSGKFLLKLMFVLFSMGTFFMLRASKLKV